MSAFDFGGKVNGRECEPLGSSKGSTWPTTKGKVPFNRIQLTVKSRKKKWVKDIRDSGGGSGIRM